MRYNAGWKDCFPGRNEQGAENGGTCAAVGADYPYVRADIWLFLTGWRHFHGDKRNHC